VTSNSRDPETNDTGEGSGNIHRIWNEVTRYIHKSQALKILRAWDWIVLGS